MGKHVCPVCEDVYAVPARVDVALDGAPETAEAWGCPRCQYRFVSVDDLARIVSAALGTSTAPVACSTTYLAEPMIVWRPGSKAESESGLPTPVGS